MKTGTVPAYPRRTPIPGAARALVFQALEDGDDAGLRSILTQHQEEARTARGTTLAQRPAGQHANDEVIGDLSWFLHFALLYGRTNVARLIPVLLDFGADPSVTAHIHGRTALGNAVAGKKTSQDQDVLRALLRGGAAVDAKDVLGYTPLHWCARGNHPESAKILLEHGASIDPTDPDGRTALDLARIYHGADAPITLLLQALHEAHAMNSDRVPTKQEQTAAEQTPSHPGRGPTRRRTL